MIFKILALPLTLTRTLTRTRTLTSVLIFEILAVFCLAGFGFRRWRFGYELGGRGKYTTGLVFGSLWVLFITLSSIYLMHDIKMW